MNHFKGQDIQSEYWCVQKVFNYSKDVRYHHKFSANDVIYFEDVNSLKSKITSIEPDTIVCLEVWNCWDTLWLYRMLNKKEIKFFAIDYYKNQPFLTDKYSEFKSIFLQKDINRLFHGVSRVISRWIFMVVSNVLNAHPPPILFVPGKYEGKVALHKSQKVISINHFDYYDFKKVEKNTKIVKEKYLVFLDIYLPHHPDITRLKLRSINPEHYYNMLDRVFTKIELDCQLKVVIAAHPKSNYTEEFGGRLHFKDKTAELVAGSEGVITHHSAAINFAVFGKKKILLLYNNDFLYAKGRMYILKSMYSYIKGYERALGCGKVNADDLPDKIIFEPVDMLRFNSYLENFLLNKDFPKDSFEIIKNVLQIK